QVPWPRTGILWPERNSMVRISTSSAIVSGQLPALAQLAQHRGDDAVGRLRRLGPHRALVRPRPLKRGELAVEQRGGHEMSLPGIEPLLDHRLLGVEKDEIDVVMAGAQDVAVAAPQGRAGEHDAFAPD